MHKVDKRRRVFPVLHRQSNLSQGLSRCIFTYPTPLVSHPKPDGTHTLMAGFQPGGRNINLDWRIQSSSFILITAVTQDTCDSVRNHCNLCWHICRKVTGEEENQDRRHERFYSSTWGRSEIYTLIDQSPKHVMKSFNEQKMLAGTQQSSSSF